jgi:hypothetical protein
MSLPLCEVLLRCAGWVRWCQIAGLLVLVCCLAYGCTQLRKERTQEDAYFEYHTLKDPSTYIRLLTLQPSSNYEDLVVCRLTAVRLKRAPPYEALSYHWGDSTHNQLILVNGRQKLITRSLLLALKDLRQPFRSRILWADGLCINQGEEAIKERNAQLLQMRTVFSRASRVMARLSGADCAFSEMFKLFEELRKLQSPEATLHSQINYPQHRKTLPKVTIKLATMSRMSKLPWWKRVWVFQEVIVATDLVLFCGTAELPWTTLTTAAHLLVCSSEIPMQNKPWCYHILRMQILRMEYKRNQQLSLVDVLSTVRGPDYGVTNPKDRVLALLGLARERDEIYKNFQLDYKQPLEELYCNVTRLAIHISGSTKILSYAGLGQSCLPSWTPDWRTGSFREDYDRMHSTLDSITGVMFHTSADSSAILDQKTPTGVLKLKGVLFDSIGHCDQARNLYNAWHFFQERQKTDVDPRGYDISADQFSLDGSTWLTEAIHQDETFEASSVGARNNYASSQDPMLIILLAIRDLCSEPSLQRTNVGVLRSLRAYILGTRREDWGDPHFLTRFRRYTGVSLEDDNVSHLRHISCNASSRRDTTSTLLSKDQCLKTLESAKALIAQQMIGYTRRGYFLTTSHGKIQAGDIVCVLLGGSVPYIVRPKDDSYILIGEAYVHGIMDGEVLEAVNRGEYALEWISLE